MSKALKKLIDINGLREFKNKLVGTDSAYVQTGAVDQTIAGTKTFSKPIAGSVTGSSGSCTGNAATATKATQDAAGNTITTTYATKTELNNGLTTKANNSEVVHKSGDETINGIKTFTSETVTTTPHAFRHIFGGYGSFWRQDETDLYLLLTNSGDQYGGWNNFRPLTVNLATGICNINGSAATATNATYANWLRTSSHTDHLFHTEWDNAGYFWTYVTASDGGYRAVRVERANSASVADTATKLAAARTIALSGAVTGTATGFDGTGNITIPVTALASSAIRAQWYAAFPDGAEAHNCMWGGRDITAAFNNGTVSANIANGTFRDIFPGDYITKQVTIPQVLADDGTTVLTEGGTYTVNWVITDCDYWINKGNQNNGMETHHVVIVPQVPIFNAQMNSTNTTEGGYAGSAMYKNIIPACATGIVNAFGSSHILTFRDYLTQDLNTSAVSSGITVFTGAPNWNGAWVSVQCNLMSEAMVYDGPHIASSALDNIMATRQMSAFRLSEKLINYNRPWWWLRDVVSSAYFAYVGGHGDASPGFASYALGVRPFALLR